MTALFFAVVSLVAAADGPTPLAFVATQSGGWEVRATPSAGWLKAQPEGKIAGPDGERVLSLHRIDPATGDAGPAIFGRHERIAHQLVFRPRFALVTGERYRAILRDGSNEIASLEQRIPLPANLPPVAVTEIYPTATSIPANQLKFYIEFSVPMREEEPIFDRIELRDDRGEAIEGAWRRTLLWSDDGRRLTLYIHPGRIKQGVNLRVEQGPVLEPERRYTLVLPTSLVDRYGRPLSQEVRRSWTTTAADSRCPRPDDWRLEFAAELPPSGTAEPAATATPVATATLSAARPLVIHFDEPLDPFVLPRSLEVRTAAGDPIAGSFTAQPGERSTRFQPAAPWPAGRHALHVADWLEDFAGNSPVRVFDTDLAEAAPAKPKLVLGFDAPR